MDGWSELIKAHGYPTVVSALLIYAAFRFARWLQPRVDSVINAHLKTVDSMGESQRQMARTQDDIKDLIVRMDRGDKIDEIHDGLGRLLAQGCARPENRPPQRGP